ncbi:MAG: ankyrin repeat domain-containing protein [Bacteroidota bacterium]
MALSLRKFFAKQKVLRKYGSFEDQTLMLAAEDGNLDCLNVLLQSGKNPNIKGRNNCSPIHRAVAHQHLQAVSLLADSSANLDAKDHTGKTPLMYAIDTGDRSIFNFLLERDADLEIMDHMNETVLFKAIKAGATTPTRKLIEAGADVNHQNIKGESPLMLAVEEEKVTIVKCLLDHDADPTLEDENGETVFGRNIPSIRIKRLLQKHSLQHRIGEHDHHLNIADTFMSSGPNTQGIIPLADGLIGQFPRLSALIIGLADGLYANLDQQYNFQGLEKKGREVIDQLETIAELAIKDQINDVPQKERPPLLNKKQFELNQALLEASQHKSQYLVDLLLKLGANPNIQNEEGKTPLHLAEQQVEIIKLLMDRGANPKIQDKSQISAIDQASSYNWKEVVILMEKI